MRPARTCAGLPRRLSTPDDPGVRVFGATSAHEPLSTAMTLHRMRSKQLRQPVPAVGTKPESLAELPVPERVLSLRDAALAQLINRQSARWPREATEDPIWGLLR